MAKFSVIIPAAGKSERFGGREKKTFAKLDGRPVFIRTLEHFINREDVCQTILAVAPEDVDTMKSKYGPNLGFMGVKLVEGGERRCDTVAAALKVVADDAEFVAVHDSARPCVTAQHIDAVFAEAVKTGAAILAAPVTGTIKRTSEAMLIEETVSRVSYYEAQTPQVFRKDIILDAYSGLDKVEEKITDDAQLVELAGHPVTIVKSDPTNLKLTTKADVALANAIIKSRPAKAAKRFGAFEEAQW
ncbi:MAG: 2-C-methyl-D-erythritol 4-phosphate cytidylyltransferase [Phycisphaerales bacterium]|nr:MAG: 2-C-methyl-D-erythritol 4-phosphate cytidylyltransferase [Phycisphaerales bacterium]